MQAEMVDKFKAGLANFTDGLNEASGRTCVEGCSERRILGWKDVVLSPWDIPQIPVLITQSADVLASASQVSHTSRKGLGLSLTVSTGMLGVS